MPIRKHFKLKYHLSAVKKPITVVSDIRRKGDLEFFENNFARLTKRIRITADLSVREKRGYSFTPGNSENCPLTF